MIQRLNPSDATDTLSGSVEQLQNKVRAAEGRFRAEGSSAIKDAAKEFESLFVAYLLKVMRETIEESGLAEAGLGKGIYTELFDQELSRSIAQQGALGISDLLTKKLSAGESVTPSTHETSPVSTTGGLNPNRSSQTSASGRHVEEPDSEIPDFQLPVQAPVSSAFGPRRDPFTRQVRFHKGVDLAAPAGMKVRAALGGEVVFSGYDHGYGNTIVIRHPGGYQTRYAHLGSLAAKAGETVEAQEVLGVVGSTGRSTGAHLHFEVSRQGERIDPMAMDRPHHHRETGA